MEDLGATQMSTPSLTSTTSVATESVPILVGLPWHGETLRWGWDVIETWVTDFCLDIPQWHLAGIAEVASIGRVNAWEGEGERGCKRGEARGGLKYAGRDFFFKCSFLSLSLCLGVRIKNLLISTARNKLCWIIFLGMKTFLLFFVCVELERRKVKK